MEKNLKGRTGLAPGARGRKESEPPKWGSFTSLVLSLDCSWIRVKLEPDPCKVGFEQNDQIFPLPAVMRIQVAPISIGPLRSRSGFGIWNSDPQHCILPYRPWLERHN